MDVSKDAHRVSWNSFIVCFFHLIELEIKISKFEKNTLGFTLSLTNRRHSEDKDSVQREMKEVVFSRAKVQVSNETANETYSLFSSQQLTWELSSLNALQSIEFQMQQTENVDTLLKTDKISNFKFKKWNISECWLFWIDERHFYLVCYFQFNIIILARCELHHFSQCIYFGFKASNSFPLVPPKIRHKYDLVPFEDIPIRVDTK